MSLDQFVRSTSVTAGRSYRDILLDVHKLIADRQRWTQGGTARDVRGRVVKPKDRTACCWCLTGAIALYSNDWGIIAPDLLRWLDELTVWYCQRTQAKFDYIEAFNDYFDHEHVVALLDEALSLLPAQ
jgi:hypothetical protein